MPEKKFDKLEYNKKYNKTFEKVISLHFAAEADKDIIDKINSAPSKVGYIRELVRADIEREKQASKYSEAE